jgi:hypothetical protein
MSSINTNGINVNYPVPGENNSSQGFRDNFASIKTNLNAASSEITDLQTKVVVKQGLSNSAVNNDMGNTLISNAAIRGFRATTHNLGNALSGTVLIDVQSGDVQYGTVVGNVSLQFGGWAPTGTQSNVELQLSVSNSAAVISFPTEMVNSNNNFGVTSLENYALAGNTTATVTVPHGISQLDYRLSSTDCGSTILIEPYNRPRIIKQVQARTPSPVGFKGDVAGDVSVDSTYMYVCTSSYNATISNAISNAAAATGNTISFTAPHSLVGPTDLNIPVIFTGTTFGGVQANVFYYVKTIPSTTSITISGTRSGGTAGSTFVVSNATGTMTATFYKGTTIWKRITLESW